MAALFYKKLNKLLSDLKKLQPIYFKCLKQHTYKEDVSFMTIENFEFTFNFEEKKTQTLFSELLFS